MNRNSSYNGTKKKTNLVPPSNALNENIAQHSLWNGLENLKAKSDEDIESEMQTFDLESSTVEEKLPLFQLFPDLEEEYPDEKLFLSRTMSATDVARLLQGKKANFGFLKACQKLSVEPRLSPVLEKSENDSSTSDTNNKN